MLGNVSVRSVSRPEDCFHCDVRWAVLGALHSGTRPRTVAHLSTHLMRLYFILILALQGLHMVITTKGSLDIHTCQLKFFVVGRTVSLVNVCFLLVAMPTVGNFCDGSKATTLEKCYGPAWLAYGHSFAADCEHDQAMAAYFTASQIMQGSGCVSVSLCMFWFVDW